MPKAIIITLLGLVCPATAVADSDGYYCIGPGYIAYETRYATQPSQHQLHVVRFSSRDGIVTMPPIVLEDFQVHGMNCQGTVIELRAWARRYTVDIADPSHPTITAGSTPLVGRPSPSGNLGHWSTEGVVDLAGDTTPEFQLVIARVARPVTGGIEHYTTSALIRRNTTPRGVIRESLTVFQGIFLETVD